MSGINVLATAVALLLVLSAGAASADLVIARHGGSDYQIVIPAEQTTAVTNLLRRTARRAYGRRWGRPLGADGPAGQTAHGYGRMAKDATARRACGRR